MTPEVSVIVPHLDQQDALLRLIESLEVQEGNQALFEVIVCDNGSASPLPPHVADHARATLVCESVPGPGPARNRAVSVSRGAILAFIDADCVADRFWLRTIEQHFRSPGAAPVIGGDVRISPRGMQMNSIEAYESIFGYRFDLYIRRDGYAGTGNLAMRRNVFEVVGPFKGIQVAEDREWGERASQLGFQTVYVPEMVVFTEARTSFRELARKWDRHIAHEFAARKGPNKKFAWLFRGLALAASPVIEIPRVMMSQRISGPRSRVLAWNTLVRIRLFRAFRMMKMLFKNDAESMAYGWRKK